MFTKSDTEVLKDVMNHKYNNCRKTKIYKIDPIVENDAISSIDNATEHLENFYKELEENIKSLKDIRNEVFVRHPLRKDLTTLINKLMCIKEEIEK